MTMFKNKFVACVKAAGKVLREQKDSENNVVTFIPFGAEYSIFLKNLNTVRALVKVEIDGVDALDGTKLIVQPNGDLNLERFIKNGNFNAGNRFKFIERTAKVEQAKGIGAEDGLVRIEFQFEKQPPEIREVIEKYTHEHQWPQWPEYTPPKSKSLYKSETLYGGTLLKSARGVCGQSSGTITSTSIPMWNATNAQDTSAVYSQTIGSGSVNASCASAQNFLNQVETQPTNEAGITVAGSVSEQQFQQGAWFPVEDTKHVIVLKLLGETGKGKVVKQPVTVKAKQKCSTCNHVNKATAKFCSECGTALELV